MHSCERTVQLQQHHLSVTIFAQSQSPNAPISGEPLWGIALKRQLVGTAHKHIANVVHPALSEAAGELINIPLPFHDPETGKYISGDHASAIVQSVRS